VDGDRSGAQSFPLSRLGHADALAMSAKAWAEELIIAMVCAMTLVMS
jgi:hypothetical protein